jgi:hypothetical protein
MPAGTYLFEPDVAADAALATGAQLTDELGARADVVLYGAALRGDAYCLGRYQHEQQALSDTTRPWLRRSTGGATLRVGAGIVYIALALAHRSTLMACPAGRLLNRNVRGVLGGLRHVGLQLNYFGRDFLSVGSEPLIYVAWDLREDGRALLEFFVAYDSAWLVPPEQQAYPARNEPMLRGRVPTTIAHARASLRPHDIVQAIADGHARNFAVAWQPRDLPTREPVAEPDRFASEPLSWSSPREEAIGFVSAGVALDATGKLARVRVAGDFFAHRACVTTLETQLVGAIPNDQVVGAAVDAVFARSGYDVEGIRSLSVIRDVILEAAQRPT